MYSKPAVGRTNVSCVVYYTGEYIRLVVHGHSYVLHISFPLYPLPDEAAPDFFRARPVANKMLSRSDATVSTPPTIAHVLNIESDIENGDTVISGAYDVRKCAKDWRVSEWTTRIGEISKLKKAPKNNCLRLCRSITPTELYLEDRRHRVGHEFLQENLH